jgi:hypothetical protein
MRLIQLARAPDAVFKQIFRIIVKTQLSPFSLRRSHPARQVDHRRFYQPVRLRLPDVFNDNKTSITRAAAECRKAQIQANSFNTPTLLEQLCSTDRGKRDRHFPGQTFQFTRI